ncbi:MAG: hypothetical protein ACQESR_27860 [Planctomycetota bacterium]
MRRRLCRATFCMVCVLPTLLIASAAVIVNTPVYRATQTARWRSQLAARLGLQVRCSRIDWAAKGQLVVHEIELRDPESQARLARAQSATIGCIDTRPVIQLSHPEVTFSRLPRLVAVLHEHLMQRNDTTGASFQLSAATVLLHKDTRSESLLDVELAVDAGHDATEAFLQFRPAGSEDGKPVRLRVARNRQLTPPATGWELHTGSAKLPCQLLSAWFPQLTRLGNTCSFEGSVWSEHLGTGWEAEISGVFRRLDLDQLVTGQFPHKLSGMAELTLPRLIIHRGRVLEAEGKLCSSGGVISRTLIKAAEEHLALKQHAPFTEAMLLRYSDLSFAFSLNEDGLAVASCGEDQYQSVLADSQGPLLSSQEAGALPSHALVRCLVPLAEMDVPASKETVSLLRALPLPEVNPVATADASSTYAPLKLRRE